MGAIYIMWLRQLKRYTRSKGRIIGSLGQPVLFLVALGFGLGPVYQKAGQGDFIQFLAPGVVAMSILFTSMFSGLEVIWDRQFGFLKETLVAPVSRTKIMIGKTLGGASVATVQGLIVLLITLLVGFRINSVLNIFYAILFMLSISFLFSAFGILIASKLEDMQAFPLIMNFIIMPLFFLSGAIFPLKGVPRFLEIIARFNPLSYGVDGLRMALGGESYLSPILDMGVILGAGLVVTIMGAYLFSKTEA